MQETVSVFDGSGLDIDRSMGDLESYSHNITANGGFDSASFSTKIPKNDRWYWIDRALGKKVVVRNRNGVVIWEGLVNSVSMEYGSVSITVGPIMNIANKVKIVYQTVDYSIVWLPSVRREIDYASNALSQSKYHIFEEIVSVNDATESMATAIQGSYLEQMAWPPIEQSVTVSGSSEPSVSVECIGWHHMLKAYYPSDFTTGAINASIKVQNLLTSDVNSIWGAGTDTSDIDENTLQVPQWEEGERTAWDAIKEIAGYGDASGNRWIFGAYENAKPYYSAVGNAYTEVTYYYDAADGIIYDDGGDVVIPNEVRAGRWAKIINLVKEPEATSLWRDPSAMFIESARYSSPARLDLSGNRFSTIQQQIARLGVGGLQ